MLDLSQVKTNETLTPGSYAALVTGIEKSLLRMVLENIIKLNLQ